MSFYDIFNKYSSNVVEGVTTITAQKAKIKTKITDIEDLVGKRNTEDSDGTVVNGIGFLAHITPDTSQTGVSVWTGNYLNSDASLNTFITDLATEITELRTLVDNGCPTSDEVDGTEFHSERLAKNSKYYEERYRALRDTTYYILIFTLITVSISILSSREIIPLSIGNILIPIIVGLFLMYLVYSYFDIQMRSQVNFDEYNFNRPGFNDRDNRGDD
jgi:hypothetical protein